VLRALRPPSAVVGGCGVAGLARTSPPALRARPHRGRRGRRARLDVRGRRARLDVRGRQRSDRATDHDGLTGQTGQSGEREGVRLPRCPLTQALVPGRARARRLGGYVDGYAVLDGRRRRAGLRLVRVAPTGRLLRGELL